MARFQMESLMKLIKYLFTGILLSGIALAMVTNGWAADNGTIPAKIVRIKGVARYTTDQKVWHPLEMGQTIKPGMTIQTGENSMVDVILGEGNVNPNPEPMPEHISYNPKVEQNLVRLWENTTMGFDKLTQMQMGSETMTDTQLDVRAGRVFGTVKKLSASSKYEVKIPNGVAGIRGTIYMVDANGIIGVLSGSVMIAYMDSNGNPQTVEVGQGQQFDTRTGEIQPLSPIFQNQLGETGHQAEPFTPLNGPTQVVTDHTIYDISPVTTTASTGGGAQNQ